MTADEIRLLRAAADAIDLRDLDGCAQALRLLADAAERREASEPGKKQGRRK